MVSFVPKANYHKATGNANQDKPTPTETELFSPLVAVFLSLSRQGKVDAADRHPGRFLPSGFVALPKQEFDAITPRFPDVESEKNGPRIVAI